MALLSLLLFFLLLEFFRDNNVNNFIYGLIKIIVNNIVIKFIYLTIFANSCLEEIFTR